MSFSPHGQSSAGRGGRPFRRRAGSARFASAAIVLFLFALVRVLVSAQDVTEPALKAAYIYNFAKFTDWPADAMPVTEPLTMCVLGDPAVGKALDQAVTGRVLEGHSMFVDLLGGAGPQRPCRILYISGISADQAGKAVAGMRDVPVLTISDIDGFIERGGIVQFFFEGGRLRFSVRVESAKRARLQISSRLLALAKQK